MSDLQRLQESYQRIYLKEDEEYHDPLSKLPSEHDEEWGEGPDDTLPPVSGDEEVPDLVNEPEHTISKADLDKELHNILDVLRGKDYPHVKEAIIRNIVNRLLGIGG